MLTLCFLALQDDSEMWVMFGAVASHKFVISFCMGMELMNSKAGTRTMVGSILFFGLITSLGIGIGGAITTGDTNNLPVAIIEVSGEIETKWRVRSDSFIFPIRRAWWLGP